MFARRRAGDRQGAAGAGTKMTAVTPSCEPATEAARPACRRAQSQAGDCSPNIDSMVQAQISSTFQVPSSSTNGISAGVV